MNNYKEVTILNEIWLGKIFHLKQIKTDSKAGYLSWQQCWKSDYRELSVLIRKLKIQTRQCMREDSYAGWYQLAVGLMVSTAYQYMSLLAETKEAARQAYKRKTQVHQTSELS